MYAADFCVAETSNQMDCGGVNKGDENVCFSL